MLRPERGRIRCPPANLTDRPSVDACRERGAARRGVARRGDAGLRSGGRAGTPILPLPPLLRSPKAGTPPSFEFDHRVPTGRASCLSRPPSARLHPTCVAPAAPRLLPRCASPAGVCRPVAARARESRNEWRYSEGRRQELGRRGDGARCGRERRGHTANRESVFVTADRLHVCTVRTCTDGCAAARAHARVCARRSHGGARVGARATRAMRICPVVTAPQRPERRGGVGGERWRRLWVRQARGMEKNGMRADTSSFDLGTRGFCGEE